MLQGPEGPRPHLQLAATSMQPRGAVEAGVHALLLGLYPSP